MNGMKPGHVPLERAISKLGIASRSQARKFILEGKVRVNTITRLDPFFPVVPETAAIVIDTEPVSKPRPRTLLLYKPKGVVTTRADEKDRPTVFSLIPEPTTHLIAVGRLDWATTGVLVLTNDTRLADRLTDPNNRVRRVYLATVRGLVTEEELDVLRKGLNEKGEWLHADEILIRKASNKETHLTVTLTEGKNREIRRLFIAIKHEVTRLKRVAFGGLELGDMQPGESRDLTPDEIRCVFPEEE